MRDRLGFVIASLVGVLVVAAATAWLPPRVQKAAPPVPIGGAFELTDQDGRRVTEKDLLGRPSAIFFGFTSCPDVCPSTLLELTNWLKMLGSDADKLNTVFISVDSERDTPEQLKLYLSSFDPRIRGLTGNEGQIEQVTKAYRVYYKRIAQDDARYTYDHSAVIYLMDKDGRYAGVLTYNEPDDSAVAKLRDLIAGRSSKVDTSGPRKEDRTPR
jgi:protein SCO1/2